MQARESCAQPAARILTSASLPAPLARAADFDLELEAAHRARVLSQREGVCLLRARTRPCTCLTCLDLPALHSLPFSSYSRPRLLTTVPALVHAAQGRGEEERRGEERRGEEMLENSELLRSTLNPKP